MVRIRLTLGLVGLVAMVACTASKPASGTADTAAKRAALDAAWTTFHDALRADDADKVFAYVADDVVMMPSGEAAVRGKRAAREWYGRFLSQYQTASLTLADREMFVENETGIVLGTYEWALKPVAGGDTIIDRGGYMQVWQQQPNGQWRFAREIVNSAAPAAK